MLLLQRSSWQKLLAGLALKALMAPHAWVLDDEAQAAK
jgi:hypothetical protein